MSEGRNDTGRPRRRRALTALARTASRVQVDLSLALLDCFLVATAYTTLLVLRFELSVPTTYWDRFKVFLPVAVVVHVAANRSWGGYGRMWQHASVEEARRLLLAGLTSGGVLLSVFAWSHRYKIPSSVIIVGPLVATIVMGAVRFQSRLFSFRRSKEAEPGLHVVVVGAGSGGAAVVREMRRNPHLGLRPVAILDDNPRARGRSLNGVSVVGGIDDLERVVEHREVHQVLLAIPSAVGEVAPRVAAAADAAGVPVKVIPGIAELVHGRVSVREARDLRIDDLLGREQVNVDFDAVKRFLRGRRVLVTGGGGSIGAEIARQVADFDPAELVLLDHDETHLHDGAEALRCLPHQVLADIRDERAVQAAFDQHLPEVVFHAAAHKHVPILETHACEAVTTNVLGTANVVEAAVRAGTERLVCVSTDKAARPTSVMGASKWLAEQIVLLRTPPAYRYCSVRFGNVLGSRGSVIPTFQQQIAAGGPVTVTDARMTRFFMSVREAVSLVLQAAAVVEHSDVFMLEMGEPVNIMELAERMIRLSGHEVGSDIPIRITGMRPGESLQEDLRGPGEEIDPTEYPSIVGLRPVRLAPDSVEQMLSKLEEFTRRGDNDACRELLIGFRAAAMPETAPAHSPR